MFIEKTDAEAEAPILWPPDVKTQLIGGDTDAGKDWRQEEKEVTEDEMVGWHHWIDGQDSEQTLGNNEGQGSLACCSPWSCKESDTIYRLNNNNNNMESGSTCFILVESQKNIQNSTKSVWKWFCFPATCEARYAWTKTVHSCKMSSINTYEDPALDLEARCIFDLQKDENSATLPTVFFKNYFS